MRIARDQPHLPGAVVRRAARAIAREDARGMQGALARRGGGVGDRSTRRRALRATKRLLARADRLGVALGAMDAHPAEAVRLLRLVVRHASKMTRRQRERAAYVAAAMPLEHPETADLLVEVARAADRVTASALLEDDAWSAEVGDMDALVARLADVIDEGLDDASRARRRRPARAARAARYHGRCRCGARCASRASRCGRTRCTRSRRRRFLCRHRRRPRASSCAIWSRSRRRTSCRAATIRAVQDQLEEDERMMADGVIAALAHVQPAEAEEALLDLIDAEHDAGWLDAGWATEALAAAFPETAAAMVDHWLKCARSYERVRALAALERLPAQLALPRLRLAASDPALPCATARDGSGSGASTPRAQSEPRARWARSCSIGPRAIASRRDWRSCRGA